MAIAVALLTPSISAIVIVSQMRQRQIDFDSRITELKQDFKDAMKDHGNEACHGSVCEDLVELKTLAMGQRDRTTGIERSLHAANEANDTLSDRIYNLQQSNRNSLGSGK